VAARGSTFGGVRGRTAHASVTGSFSENDVSAPYTTDTPVPDITDDADRPVGTVLDNTLSRFEVQEGRTGVGATPAGMIWTGNCIA
jgi:hypothetical protein